MQLKRRALGALAGLLTVASLGGTAIGADRAYTEGTVSSVSAVRTEPGMFDAYMAYLAGPYKQIMESAKAAGLVVDYRVYATTPRSPGDPDVYLITTYKNMAAMDGLQDKMDPIQEKVQGDQAAQTAKTIERGKMRELIGSQLVRKLELK
jgi:hypothetical protein